VFLFVVRLWQSHLKTSKKCVLFDQTVISVCVLKLADYFVPIAKRGLKESYRCFLISVWNLVYELKSSELTLLFFSRFSCFTSGACVSVVLMVFAKRQVVFSHCSPFLLRPSCEQSQLSPDVANTELKHDLLLENFRSDSNWHRNILDFRHISFDCKVNLKTRSWT